MVRQIKSKLLTTIRLLVPFFRVRRKVETLQHLRFGVCMMVCLGEQVTNHVCSVDCLHQNLHSSHL